MEASESTKTLKCESAWQIFHIAGAATRTLGLGATGLFECRVDKWKKKSWLLEENLCK